MRPLAIVSLLLVMLAGLALTPDASAAPPQPSCNGTWATTQTIGPVTVFASPPCYEVSVRTMSCPLSEDKWTEARSGPVAVRVQTCDKVDGTGSAAMAAPCTCPPPPTCNGVSTVGPIANVVSVTVTDDCRVIVELLPVLACNGDPLDGRKAITQGRITVVLPCGQIDSCEAPFDCAPASLQPIPPVVCGPTSMCTEPELGICDYPDMCNDAGCPYPIGAEHGTNLQAGPITVSNPCGPQSLCSGPMRCTDPFGNAASAQVPPVCIERNVEQGPLTAHVGECGPQSAYVDLCPDSWGSPQRVEHTEDVLGKGLVVVGAEACMPHSPPPLGAVATDSGPCGSSGDLTGLFDPARLCPAPYPITPCDDVAVAAASALPIGVTYTLSPECRLDVYAKADVMDCLWGEGYQKTASAGPVTLWTWGCNPPYPPTETQADSTPCICPPPRPLCYDVNRAIAWGDDVSVDDWCNATVNLHAYCGLQGTDYHQVKVGKLTVNYETCQQPPQE